MPLCFLKLALRKTKKKIFLEHAKKLETRKNGNDKIHFPKKRVKNDVIPDFIKCLIPKNDVFSDQAVRDFQHRLLETEINSAREK